MKVIFAALSLLVLCAVICAQTPRTKRRAPSGSKNLPPTVKLKLSSGVILLPDAGNNSYVVPCSENMEVGIWGSVEASDPDGDKLSLSYFTTGGQLISEGANFRWYLKGVKPGNYKIRARVEDGHKHKSSASSSVEVLACTGCDPPCPTFNIAGPEDAIDEGQLITFIAQVSACPSEIAQARYVWTISAGKITEGQGTTSITVDTAGAGGKDLTALLKISGIDPSCLNQASYKVKIRSKN